MSDDVNALGRGRADRALNLSRTWWKRPFDLAVTVPLMVLALPLILVLAAVVRFDSPGPAFFLQERVGIGGSRFRMWKLRSMRTDARQEAHERAAEAWFTDPTLARYKSLEDPRITRLGRYLRRSNLDELPQLFNVLRGEMSLVGPRPAIPYELKFYRPQDFDRQAVRPGITGVWQLSDRDRISATRMMELDARYVSTQSPWLDARILFDTLLLVASILTRRSTRP